MRYATFKISDEKGINAFLEKNADFLGKDGLSYRKGGAFAEDRVCIFYDDSSPQEKSVRLGIAAMYEFIDQQRSQLLGAATDEAYWLKEQARGNAKADGNIREAAERGTRIKEQIDIAIELVRTLKETGQFPATLIPSNEVMSADLGDDEREEESGAR